jgi:mRNA-degrading endonuclease toxin of MazEF toxin-antitoxin module
LTVSPKPRRGEIWVAVLPGDVKRHWVVVISVDARNLSDRTESVLVVPFGSSGAPSPTVLEMPPGETGLPAASYLKGHFIQVIRKERLLERLPRMLSGTRLRQVVTCIRRAVDPEETLAAQPIAPR